jgi:hypothetical protein
VWQRSSPLGESDAVRGLGATVAPLLSGFSLAAIVALINVDPSRKPPLTDFAIGAFAVTVALLLQAMQFAFLVLRYSAPPESRLNVNPRARQSPVELNGERDVQWHDFLAAEFYRRRVYVLYELGLLGFLTGLLLVMIPKTWSAGRIIGLAAITVSTLFEAVWGLNNRLRRRRGFKWLYRWLLPTRIQIAERNTRRIEKKRTPWLRPIEELDASGIQSVITETSPTSATPSTANTSMPQRPEVVVGGIVSRTVEGWYASLIRSK